MDGDGSCLFLAVQRARSDKGAGESAAGLRERVVDGMQRAGAATPEYANHMLEAGTWGTDKEIMGIAEEIRMVGTVVVMRPRQGEKVVQVFRPEHHDGNVTIVYRPGHFNAARPTDGELTGWELHVLNARGRKCMRRAAAAMGEMRVWQRAGYAYGGNSV